MRRFSILLRNIVVVLALILIGVMIGLALGGQGENGGDVQTSSPASTAATGMGPEETSSRAASPTPAQGLESERAPAAEWGVVVRVADGDTLTVQFDDGEEETIRFLDVDTPETVHPTRPEECYGAQASDFTKTLMGQRVGIEEMGRDRYGRLLAYVWTEPEEGGQLWNVRLLEEGLAVYNDYGNPGKYADTSRAAAENALLSGVGLWSACTLGEPATPTPAPTPTPVPTRSAQDGQAVCPQGCVSQPDPSCSIKGNVNTRNDTKIYHVEGVSSSYNRVNMKESDGDLWFCTIEEAEANGFRAPRN
jgi:micrococcal nuclease